MKSLIDASRHCSSVRIRTSESLIASSFQESRTQRGVFIGKEIPLRRLCLAQNVRLATHCCWAAIWRT
jgi:hypothetical protein